MLHTTARRTLVELQLIAGLLCAPFVCLAQQVSLPQCPQFAGTPQASASCITDVTDIAFDATGTAWIADNTYKSPGRVLRLPGIRVGQVPSSNQTADLVLGKPNFTTLTNGSCQACAIDVPVKLAFDSQGALWVADKNSSGFAPPMLHRFSPPFTNGQAADLVVPAYYASGGMVFDASGNLWIASPYSCGSVLRYSPPFSATMQPNLVLGQPSTSAASCVSTPGPNVLSGVQGLAFGPDGSLFVADTASNRIAVFRPPFQTFMNATFAIGQANLTSYQPVPFAQGGLPDIVGLAIDPNGKLWVLNNNHQYLAVYSPPFSTGMARDSWFDFVTGQTSNGSSFPYSFNGFSSIRFTPDSSLWFASSGTYSGLGAIAVLTPSALQQAELPPVQVVLPQFAFGGGWYSALYFTNTGNGAVSFTVNFLADSGTPLIVP
jgi:sugar lactone lactonase YvrE